MGVDISDIVEAREIDLQDLRGKIIAIDAYNTLYQFLSIIRQPDGTPLMDRNGKITSHLSGLFYRNVNIMEIGIKPVYVFDGKPPELKGKTILERIERKERAEREWKEALEAGNLEEARIWSQQSSRLTPEMVEQSKRLLELMGIPWVQAPSEGEAQAAKMARDGRVYASASQDFDSLLFGTPRLVRNLTITGKRKLPRKNVYKEIKPEIIELEKVLSDLSITREQLIDIGILVGTDFNEGVKNVGPKKALKLIKTYGRIEEIINNTEIKLDNYNDIREIFLNPPVTNEYSFEWKDPNIEGIISFMCDEHDFSRDRVMGAIEKLKEFRKVRSQKNLEEWF
ncbi:MAG: flap endonuclease-1 [Thermoplasmata archaeon]|jgi:flap endonuclease 1 (EC 3.1.-.-)|nr:flap endonuclease-1 [Thermoplasmata archaeon]MVT13486.1 flap endonuclease-1 [Euryarchaeota archaeon]MVT15082.1 flap endonuclease-1 [Euryarchaeota archaeon]MVT35522.1 flap endonuclease-1 [Euryarchaeota archaeon]